MAAYIEKKKEFDKMFHILTLKQQLECNKQRRTAPLKNQRRGRTSLLLAVCKKFVNSLLI